MEKIYLQKVQQFDCPCYIGKADPRKIVRIATKVEMGEGQDAQRPLNEKRVKDIAKYVNDKGMLPTTLTLASTDDRLKVKKVSENSDLYEMEIPSTEEEYEAFADAIDVMDGQHRLYSFLSEIRKIADNQIYEIGFTLYITPSLDTRRKIFITCNEKQEKVSGNLLLWFKYKLDMIPDDEKSLYNLVAKLNETYPLKGHIIMSAEKVKNGIKAKELMDVIKRARITSLKYNNGNNLTEEQIIQIICTYLKSWEHVVGFTFNSARTSTKATGAATKIAGVRYMLSLLPTLWRKSMNLKRKFNSDFIEGQIKQFISLCGIEFNKFFTCDENKVRFSGRSSIVAFANESMETINSMSEEEFDPLA